MNKSVPLSVAGFIFLFVAFLHALRIATKIPIVVGGYLIPINFSWIGLVVFLVLAIWMFWAARKVR